MRGTHFFSTIEELQNWLKHEQRRWKAQLRDVEKATRSTKRTAADLDNRGKEVFNEDPVQGGREKDVIDDGKNSDEQTKQDDPGLGKGDGRDGKSTKKATKRVNSYVPVCVDRCALKFCFFRTPSSIPPSVSGTPKYFGFEDGDLDKSIENWLWGLSTVWCEPDSASFV